MKSLFKILILTIVLTIPTLSQGADVTKFVPKEPIEPMSFAAGKKYLALITTDKGVITVQLDAQKAPLSVTNFIQLANGGFYKGLTFHRVVPNFVIQGGDPDGTGSGGPGYTVKGEVDNGLKHIKGAIAWARTGDQINSERRSSGSQFYLTLAATPHLDGAYSVFGNTIAGQDVIDKIAVGDKILDVVITVD